MKITTSVVNKVAIYGVPNMDAISVIVENFDQGSGKITITCFHDSWTYWWGSMGEQHTMETFFMSCSNNYLACKLSTGIRTVVNDESEEALSTCLRAKIVRLRREGEINHEKARDLWSLAIHSATDDYGHLHVDTFYEVFGSDWYDYVPKKPNDEYDYLCKVVETVKAVFKQLEEEKASTEDVTVS